jgi:hypothetical protein
LYFILCHYFLLTNRINHYKDSFHCHAERVPQPSSALTPRRQESSHGHNTNVMHTAMCCHTAPAGFPFPRLNAASGRGPIFSVPGQKTMRDSIILEINGIFVGAVISSGTPHQKRFYAVHESVHALHNHVFSEQDDIRRLIVRHFHHTAPLGTQSVHEGRAAKTLPDKRAGIIA